LPRPAAGRAQQAQRGYGRAGGGRGGGGAPARARTRAPRAGAAGAARASSTACCPAGRRAGTQSAPPPAPRAARGTRAGTPPAPPRAAAAATRRRPPPGPGAGISGAFFAHGRSLWAPKRCDPAWPPAASGLLGGGAEGKRQRRPCAGARDRRARRRLLGARLQPPAQASLAAQRRPGRTHRVARLRGRRRLAQAREAQPEHAIHARAVAAVQCIQFRLQVGQPHLRAQHVSSVAAACRSHARLLPLLCAGTWIQRAASAHPRSISYIPCRAGLVPRRTTVDLHSYLPVLHRYPRPGV